MKTFIVALSLFVVPVLSIGTLTDQQISRVEDLLETVDTVNTNTTWYRSDGIQLILAISKLNYDNIHSLYKLVDTNNNLVTKLSETIGKCGASSENSVFFIERILFPIVQRLIDEMKECKKVVFPSQPHQQYPQPPNRNHYPTANGVTVDIVDQAFIQDVLKANQKTQGQTQNGFYVRK